MSKRNQGALGLLETVVISGVHVDRLTRSQVVECVVAEIEAGRGGHIVTPNVDILARIKHDEDLRTLVESCELVVADGAPLVWASHVAGSPLPERVAGSDLVWSLATAGAQRGWRIALLGGTPNEAAQPTRVAGEVLEESYPGIKMVGTWCPPMGFEKDDGQWAALVRKVQEARPDVVYVGLGFPKQEEVIERLRAASPRTWFLGCGASIDFIAGYRKRAPQWMQRTGTEWIFRMLSEPRRLVYRYVVVGIPAALSMLAGALRQRWDLRAALKKKP